MRRVVTGEEIAQLRNPDPFAAPAWRSPVYRTPLGSWPSSTSPDLLARLVRFLFRHPPWSLAAIVGVLMWRLIGWLGLAVLAVSIAAVLVMWRWRFPVSFSRFIGTPARGAVAGLALPPALGRGDDHRPPRTGLPGPDHAARPRQGDGDPLHRPGARSGSCPGQSAADFAARADNLAHGFGAMLCRVRTASPGALVLEFVRRDALAAIIPACPSPALWTCGRCRSAAARTAACGWSGCTAPTADRGSTGAGKASLSGA